MMKDKVADENRARSGESKGRASKNALAVCQVMWSVK
jgi:hypothetical protein